MCCAQRAAPSREHLLIWPEKPAMSTAVHTFVQDLAVKGLSATAALTIDHALVHVWREAQLARTCEEHEDFLIALKVLGLLHRGGSGPGLFNLAVTFVTGLPHAKYLYRRAERAEFQRLELLRGIPDYDYSLEPRIPDCDRTDGRRHFGNQFRKKHIIALKIKQIDSLCGSTQDLGKLPIDTQIANSPILNTNEDTALKLARIEQTQKARLSAWSESARAKRKQTLGENAVKNAVKNEQRLVEDARKKLLDNVSDYLYAEAQGARNASEQDSYTLALHLIAAVRRGDPDPLLCASYTAFGGSFPIYTQRRADLQWFMRQEFIRALPQEEKSVSFSLWLLRESQGLTQEQLAKRIRRPRQLVSEWEIGQPPTAESLRRLSRGLRIPVSVILRLAEARRPI